MFETDGIGQTPSSLKRYRVKYAIRQNNFVSFHQIWQTVEFTKFMYTTQLTWQKDSQSIVFTSRPTILQTFNLLWRLLITPLSRTSLLWCVVRDIGVINKRHNKQNVCNVVGTYVKTMNWLSFVMQTELFIWILWIGVENLYRCIIYKLNKKTRDLGSEHDMRSSVGVKITPNRWLEWGAFLI